MISVMESAPIQVVFFLKKKDMMHTNKFDIHVNPKKIKCHSIVLVKNRRIGILDLNFKK
jgi:hypothetical protein